MKKPLIREIFKTPKGTDLRILNLRGKEYLEVSQRIVWFREEHPDWRITTEFVKLEEKFAIACARVLDAQGNVMSMSHKREDQKSFPDFMEKAETGAIGRALALVGFGTQFCADELDEGKRIVDSPQARENSQSQDDLDAFLNLSDEQIAEGFKTYIIPIGKQIKGKRLDEVEPSELKKAMNWLVQRGGLQGEEKRFVEVCQSYLNSYNH